MLVEANGQGDFLEKDQQLQSQPCSHHVEHFSRVDLRPGYTGCVSAKPLGLTRADSLWLPLVDRPGCPPVSLTSPETTRTSPTRRRSHVTGSSTCQEHTGGKRCDSISRWRLLLHSDSVRAVAPICQRFTLVFDSVLIVYSACSNTSPSR